jgi:membrane-associated phospholipid phosphatase
MRSRFCGDLPLARHSAWCLLILMGHVFLNHLDRVVHDLMQDADPHVIVFFRAVTELGDSKWTLVPTGVAGLLLLVAGRYVLSGHRLVAMTNWLASALLFVFTSVAVSGIVTNIIKVIVGRGRPKLLDQTGLTGFDPFTLDAGFHSFPSGHTNTAFAVAFAVSFLIPPWRGGLLAVASVVGFSRVAVNAHFVTDVIAGAALAGPTTWWLRQRFTAFGLVFTRGGAGEYAPRWPGRLIPVAVGRLIRRIPLAGASAPAKVGRA